MTKIAETVKSLMFAYSAAMVIIALAIIQSDRATYDRALNSLREIQILSATIDPDLIKILVEDNVASISETTTETWRMKEIGQVVEFRFSPVSIDFSSFPDEFVGEPPVGVDFGRSQVVDLPNNFTELVGINHIHRPLLQPKSLDRYAQLHDASLRPVTYLSLQPDFQSQVRIEAYADPVREYNSAERLQRVQPRTGRVVDPITLERAQNSGGDRVCNLTPRRTKLNERPVYFCNLGATEFEGTQHLGVRVIIPAKPRLQPISSGTIAAELSIPTQRRGDFQTVHPDLAHLATPYSYLAFEDLRTVLETERERSPSTVSLFGAVINLDLVVRFVLGSLALFFFYVSLHLREATRVSKIIEEDEKSTWLPTYPGSANTILVFAQLFILPGLVSWIFVQRSAIELDWLFWFSFTIQFFSAIWCFVEVFRLRDTLLATTD